MPSISEIKNIIVAVALSFLSGIGIGFYVKAEFVEADQVDQVTDARHETADNIVQSHEADKKLDNEVAKSDAKIEKIRTIVQTRIVKETTNEPSCTTANRFDLDVGTVGLLNSARSGAPGDPAAISDESGKASSGLTLSELLDNDLEVVQRYHELAKDHDALVDFVENFMKKQAKQ